VIGQDSEQTGEGVFRIARRTAPDRVISTVDPQARHGRKSSAHGFDGYKGHMAVDPDSEIITAAEVGDANGGDGEMMPELLEEFMPAQPEVVPEPQEPTQPEAPVDGCRHLEPPSASAGELAAPAIYGDSAYGGGASLALLEQMGATPMVKVQAPHARNGC